MKRGTRKMDSIHFATKKIINSPQKNLSKAQAKEILVQCGILTNDNKIKKAYTDIIIEKGQRT